MFRKPIWYELINNIDGATANWLVLYLQFINLFLAWKMISIWNCFNPLTKADFPIFPIISRKKCDIFTIKNPLEQ